MSIQIRVLLFKVSQRSVGVFFPCPMTLFCCLNHVSCLGPGTECVLVSCLGNKIKYLSGNLVKYSDSLKVTSIIAHINGGDMNQATTSRVGTIHYNITIHYNVATLRNLHDNLHDGAPSKGQAGARCDLITSPFSVCILHTLSYFSDFPRS